MTTSTAQPRFNYGGQAVIEGVMMRGSKALAVAVRDPHGQIVMHSEPINAALYSGTISRIPFLRGLSMLWDALGLGMRSLMYSANIAASAIDQPPAASTVNPPGAAGSIESAPAEAKTSDIFNGPIGWGVMAFSIVFALVIFLFIPKWIASAFEGSVSKLGSAIIEGVVRLLIFIAYIWLIGRSREIGRVFGYHGAEHKTINAYEAGDELTVENVQRHSLQHPRCGTAFLLTVVLLSIVFFAPLNGLPFALGLVLRVLLLPVVAMFAYEYIRFSARHLKNPIMRALIAPNLAMQLLTTRQPDNSMVEVAITALKKVLDTEQLQPLNPERMIP
jgi:uncharacterized protein YqhQ